MFLKNVNEVSGWIREKMQIATDESYRDPTNLQGKIQKHQAFDAEVASNKRRMEGVTVVSTEMLVRSSRGQRSTGFVLIGRNLGCHVSQTSCW